MKTAPECLTVRRLREGDLKKALSLSREAAKGWGKDWLNFILASYRNAVAGCGCESAFGAFCDGELVGTFLLRRDVDALVIFFVTVKKEMRHMRIGSSIIGFARSYAKRTGAKIMRVDVAAEISKGEFYRKLGFRRGGVVRNFYMKDDEQLFFWKKV